jgi:hypothetical protein
MKIYRSKQNRPFRLSKIEKEKHGYSCVIKWMDTEKFETFALQTIEPYLK